MLQTSCSLCVRVRAVLTIRKQVNFDWPKCPGRSSDLASQCDCFAFAYAVLAYSCSCATRHLGRRTQHFAQRTQHRLASTGRRPAKLNGIFCNRLSFIRVALQDLFGTLNLLMFTLHYIVSFISHASLKRRKLEVSWSVLIRNRTEKQVRSLSAYADALY